MRAPYGKKYNKQNLQEAADQSTSLAGVLRYFGLAQTGGNQTYLKKKIVEYGVDTSHFVGQAHMKGRPARKRLAPEQILVKQEDGSRKRDAKMLRRAMVEYGFDYCCVGCGISDEYNGELIILEVDHIDCNPVNNSPDNLRFFCPNCHTQRHLQENIKRREEKIANKLCCDCGLRVHARSQRCTDCAAKHRVESRRKK
jgi:hypothetical protein